MSNVSRHFHLLRRLSHCHSCGGVAERRAVLRVHSKEYLNFVQDLASSIDFPEPFTPKVQKQLRSDPEHLVCI